MRCNPRAIAVLRIGTRGSPLALVQARAVRARLAAAHGIAAERIELEVIRTTGDTIRDRPLAELGGKGLFTKEIEEALAAGAIDLAVHSAKDMPTVLPAGLAIAAVLPREDARDVFISRKAGTLARACARRRGRHRLAAAAGAGEARACPISRSCRCAAMSRPGCASSTTASVDATLLALAGLKRLGLADAATAVLLDRGVPAGGRAGRDRDRGARR